MIQLKDICDIYDCPHTTAKDEGKGYPLVRTPNVGKGRLLLNGIHRVSEEVYNSRNSRAIPEEGDLILAREAPVGNVSIIMQGQRVCLGQRVVLIKPKRELVDPHYLTYYLLSAEVQNRLKNHANGAVVAHLNVTDIRNLLVSLPELDEQIAIGKILRSIEDKIELNNGINHNLEQQVQALYKSWFVDFEPFRGGKFVDSELGLIPEGWDAKPLSSICHIEKKTINPQKHPTCLFTHYSIPAYDNSELPELQKGSDILSNKYIISDYTILFSKLNPRIKRIWNVYKSESNPICSTEFVVYKPMDIDTYPFLYSFITGDDFYNNIMSKVNGATGSHQRFHPEETLDILVPYHIDCYRLYSQLVLPIIQQIDENKRENHYFSSLRDSLLPKLMSGELKINDLTC